MEARPYWQGQIRLALVSIPVQIFAATKSGASVTFRQIHEPSGKPVKYEKVVPGIGPVDTDEILKGFEYERGSYVLLENDELDWLRNQRGSTAVLPYVVRARAGAPVAAPVSWEELRGIDRASNFHIGDAETLLTRAASNDLKSWGIALQTLTAF
jgi:hypothetical protein